MVNEFFESAILRNLSPGRDPKPYFLYLDEFQNFVSLDIARMLAEVRKFGLFLVLSHQYFEQLDEEIIAAALNNCQIKTVFGGLSATNARLMAEELFIGKLDPMKVKASIYQTKFWPEYRRDKVYGKGSSSGSSHGSTYASASATFSGMSSGQSFYTPDSWLGSPTTAGTSTEGTSSGSTNSSSSGYSDSDSYSTSESEADIPIFFPVPFQELSSVQYYTVDEQLTELTAALKIQFQRHCFIQIRQQETQPMLVPFVEPVTTFTYDRSMLNYYIKRQHERQHALPAAEVDLLLEQQEADLLQAAAPSILIPIETEQHTILFVPAPGAPPPKSTTAPIWNRAGSSESADVPKALARKRGPQPDMENHEKVVKIIRAYGENWTSDDNLLEICEELDRQEVPSPKTWATRSDGVARTWSRGRHHYQYLVIKAIKDRLRAAAGQA